MQRLTAARVVLPEVEDLAQRLLCSADSFPPCDVLWTGERSLRITLAVAGFSVDELQLTVAGDHLVVRGRRQVEAAPRHYLHHGIAMRRFQRSFLLRSGLQVKAARLDHGLLNIDLESAGQPAGRSISIGDPEPDA